MVRETFSQDLQAFRDLAERFSQRVEELTDAELTALSTSLPTNLIQKLWEMQHADQSGQSHARTRLYSTDEKFARAFHSKPTGLTITRAVDGVYIDANPAFCELTGFTRDELIGHGPVELGLLSQTDREKYRKKMAEDETYHQQEFALTIKDGSRRQVFISFEQITIQDEPCMLATLIDVTERKRAEDRLAYQAMFLDFVQEAIIATDTAQRITYWNKGAERLYGWTAQEAVGQVIGRLLGSETSEDIGSQDWKKLDTQGTLMGVVTQETKNHQRIIIEFSALPIRDDEGQLCGYVTANRDVTPRIRAEQERQDSEAKFQTIFQYSPLAILLSREANGKIVDANPAGLELLDYPREELIGKTSVELGIFPDENTRQKLFIDELQFG